MIQYTLRKPNRFVDKRIIVGMVYELTEEEAWVAAYEYVMLHQLDLMLYKGNRCVAELRFKHMPDKP